MPKLISMVAGLSEIEKHVDGVNTALQTECVVSREKIENIIEKTHNESDPCPDCAETNDGFMCGECKERLTDAIVKAIKTGSVISVKKEGRDELV